LTYLLNGKNKNFNSVFKNIYNLIYTRAQKYGKTFKFQTLHEIVVHTCDLQATKEVIIEKNFPKVRGLYNSLGYPHNIR
jgi:hypothetical protein